MSKILVTGASGLVGSRFQELNKENSSFENLDLTNNVDITNETQTKTKIEESGAGELVHFAAFTNVNAANEQKDDKKGSCYKVNVLGTRYVAQSCKATNKYLVHISTDFVFDGKKDTPYTEEDSPNPIEWYGRTKLWAEEEVENSGAKACIVRITYPYRAHHPTRIDLVRNILKKLKDNSLPPMFTDHIITPTFIDDISHALKVILEKKPQGIFHVTGSTSLSDHALAVEIAKVFGYDQEKIKKGSLKEFLKTAKRPYQLKLADSNAKLKKELGVTMSTIEQGLIKMKQQTFKG